MIRGRRIAIVVSLVAIAVLFLTGTTYARSLISLEPERETPVGCSSLAMSDMDTTMWGSLDMNAMHESMHGPEGGVDMDSMHASMGGEGEPGGGTCHGDEAGESRYPMRSMMRGML
jgi:hypothetical protein